VMGVPFYVMNRIPGVILRRALPDWLPFPPETARALSENFVDTLVRLHAIDPEPLGLGDLGNAEGYVERQGKGWAKRYMDAMTDDVPAMTRLGSWLASKIPDVAGRPGTIIHNDFKYDNCVLDQNDITRIRGVLDWEMSTIGDPLMDLGTTLAYWCEASDDDL